MAGSGQKLEQARATLQAEAVPILMQAQGIHGIRIPPATFTLTGLVKKLRKPQIVGLLCYAVETDGMAREVGLLIGKERLEAGGSSPVRDIVLEQLRWLGVLSPRARKSDPFVEATFSYVAGYPVRDTLVTQR